MRHIRVFVQLLLLLALYPAPVCAADKSYSFGVLNQRSITLTAEYWNPILKYVSNKSGIPLHLAMVKTAPESSAMVGRAEYDFVYSNAIFSPENAQAGYQVFARPVGNAIKGQIVVLEDSPLHSLKKLDGLEVGFPSQTAFIGYFLTMNALKKAGIRVTPKFAGNQEGIMAQLKGKRVVAAGVNSQVMFEYAQREGFSYRALWSSEGYLNLPLAARPSVPRNMVNAVRAAFTGMASDPEGMNILKDSADIIKQHPPLGFVAAKDSDYSNYLEFYKHSLLQEKGR